MLGVETRGGQSRVTTRKPVPSWRDVARFRSPVHDRRFVTCRDPQFAMQTSNEKRLAARERLRKRERETVRMFSNPNSTLSVENRRKWIPSIFRSTQIQPNLKNAQLERMTIFDSKNPNFLIFNFESTFYKRISHSIFRAVIANKYLSHSINGGRR